MDCYDKARPYKQRCFMIPRAKLDLFLVKLNMSRQNLSHYEAEFVFQREEAYDVVVNCYGSYPYMENEIEKFSKEIWRVEV